MINFKVLLASLLVAGVSAQTTFAQVASEKKKSGYPYAFVGVQGGGQVTFGIMMLRNSLPQLGL